MDSQEVRYFATSEERELFFYYQYLRYLQTGSWPAPTEDCSPPKKQEKPRERKGRKRQKRVVVSELRKMILRRDGHKCFFCKSHKKLHVHHLLPRSKGGSDDPENLLAVCDICHARLHEGEAVHNIMSTHRS